MRFLHVVPTYFPASRYGGPIVSVHALCRSLVNKGHEVQVVTTNVDGKGDSNVPLKQLVDLDGVSVRYFPSRFGRRLYYSPSMMYFLQHRLAEFDLVHLHSIFLWPTWAAARVAQEKNVPYIISPRGMLVKDLIRRKSRWLKTAWIRLIEQNNIKHAAGVHVTSLIEAEEMKDFQFQASQIYTIPNGVEEPAGWTDDELSVDIRKVIGGKPFVLFFGRINWKKGLDRLIKAWRGIQNIHLVIAGNDEENYLLMLQEIAKEAKVSNQITFITRSISGADKEALFASARLFVLSSYSENFGNTVLEAMIRSVPVVVTEEVGAASVVMECGGGKVVHADDLADIVSSMWRDEKSSVSMGQKGREWVRQQYSWDSIADQMVDCYKRALEVC